MYCTYYLTIHNTFMNDEKVTSESGNGIPTVSVSITLCTFSNKPFFFMFSQDWL